MEIGRVPWLLALLTAGWFGWMASCAGRSWILWAVGGATFGLVISTIVLGLAQAATIPFSDQERRADQIKWTIAAVVIIAAAGWALTSSLHRHHLAIWRRLKPGSSPTEPPPTDAKTPNAPLAKQPGGRA
jgi:hypothetical protein